MEEVLKEVYESPARIERRKLAREAKEAETKALEASE